MTAALAETIDTATLPAPPRVVLRAAPRREPPFDDELDSSARVTGPLDRHLPLEIVRPSRAAWRPVETRRSENPDPAAWSRRLLVGMIESAGGRRPLRQLAAFLSPSVHHGLTREFERAAATGTPHWLHRAGVRTVRADEPSDGVAELCAVLDVGPRARALAMRLELHRGHWRCTRLQIG